MALGPVLLITSVAVCIGLVSTCWICLERIDIQRTVADFKAHFLDAAPYVAAALLFFVAKRATHGYSLRISHALDWDITSEIFAVEGALVAAVQRVVPEVTLEFFTVMYMFGFPYLLVTAPVLYFFVGARHSLKKLLVAYLLNYVVGSICYTLFIAYGPRIHLASVDGLMYDAYPQTQSLTAAVSSNTDVFPSLHTSLAVVVVLLAWQSRRHLPRWLPISAFVAVSVVFSTMYLGIHWAVDVVAGVVLAVWSVIVAHRLVDWIERPAGRDAAVDGTEDGISSSTDLDD
ncbi:phosphatase PAP2 family protein [Halopiger goleimassiliensis]|uniref:phosphatase PAP2 family protein n=1 Tax=Halopiger goleimassiliensis TaxID=1293048 RepID=UPI000677AB52|nr:phosphatase PAP2 family protein [Halopiger goleimassiliensis]